MDAQVLPDFRLRSLLALAREGSVTAAAAAVGLTQPAVSRQLDELEDDYGAALFERRGRNLVPTEAGRTLIDCAVRIEALYRDTRRAVDESAGRLALLVGATLTVAEYFLPPVLAAFHDAKPAAELGLVVANTAEIIRRLRGGELGLAVVEGPFDPEGLESAPIADDRLVAIGPGKGDGRLDRKLSLEELLGLPLILREEGSGTRAVFEGWLLGQGCDPGRMKPAMEIGSLGTIKALVARGLGYSVISARAIEGEVASGSLGRLEVEGFPIRRELRLVSRPGGPSLASEAFMEALALAAPASPR